MASPTKLTDFKSRCTATEIDILGTQNPGCNPFDDGLKKTENIYNDLRLSSSFDCLSTSFKDMDRPSLAPIDLNTSDLLNRESLGILPNMALFRDSLTPGLLNISDKGKLEASLSPRESLGVLNISAMEFGRESIGLFNIQNSFLRKKSIGEENFDFNLDNFNFDNMENDGLKTIKKSPLQLENPVPELVLSTSTTQERINSFSLSGLNKAFLYSQSRISSAGSSVSPYNISFNSYFNSRSLNEPSKVSPGSSQKDSEINQSAFVPIDPFNEAFQVNSENNNKHSVSQIVTSASAKNSFSNNLEDIRNRIQSLPVALEDYILSDMDLQPNGLNASLENAIICRGREEELDDSVFVEARKVASIIADTSFNADEKSFDSKEHNILDATPQPEWPEDLDSSQTSIQEKKSPKCDKETILKQVDKMLGMQPVNLEEKLKSKNGSKSDSISLDNISENISKISGISPGNNAENQSFASNNFSQNLSKISRTSPEDKIPVENQNQSCASNNFSQNISKITQTSEENVSRLIKNLSDILNDNENLSQTQKNEGRNMLHRLANMLRDSMSKSSSSAEDSGHSSVGDQNLEDNKCKSSENEVQKDANSSKEICQALDLSIKGKSGGEVNKRLSMSKSPTPLGSPAYLTKKVPHKEMTNASSASMGSDMSEANTNISKGNHSNASNFSNASTKSSNISTVTRHSNISQNRVSLGAGKLKKSKLGVVAAKKGPLRAVLPVENMAKVKNVATVAESPPTPERKDEEPKFGLCSKKTSTPIQEPKLKPMAASTPASRQSNEHAAVSPLARPKYNNRSFSYRARASSASLPPENTKIKESNSTRIAVNKSRAKVDEIKLVRRNSVTEGTLQKDSEGPMRIKRSFSTGKEPKILSALNRVRQNILNSPYYNPRKSDGAHNPVIAENMRKVADLQGCGSELKRLSMIAHQSKHGKENIQP